ncbi:hypothetical protein T01_242, partial [Trichinella spiralis]
MGTATSAERSKQAKKKNTSIEDASFVEENVTKK